MICIRIKRVRERGMYSSQRKWVICMYKNRRRKRERQIQKCKERTSEKKVNHALNTTT